MVAVRLSQSIWEWRSSSIDWNRHASRKERKGERWAAFWQYTDAEYSP